MDDPSLRAAGADEAGEKQGQSAQVPAASGQDTDVTVILVDEVAGERGKDQAQHKRIMPLKRPNLDVRAEFDLETNGALKTEAKSKHCKAIVQTAKTVNTSRLRTHLVSVCQKAPGDIKERAYESGQDAKKAKKTLALMPLRLARCAMCKTKYTKSQSRPVRLIVTTYKPEKSGHNKNKKNGAQKQKLKLHLSFSETRFGA